MDVFDLIVSYRKTHVAPVDVFGCARNIFGSSKREKRLCIYLSAVLSSQTKDQKVAEAMDILNSQNLLSHKALLDTSVSVLAAAISPVCFYRKKAVYIKRGLEIMDKRHMQDIPKSVEELQRLPGVGRKISFLVLYHAWGICSGISVDTHVHRVSNRIGFVEESRPQNTQKRLEELFAQDSWPIVNETLVGFGQICCKAKKPACGKCPINRHCRYLYKTSRDK